jgi:hypothetical protein
MTKTLGFLALLATAIVGAAVPAAAGPRPIIKAIGVFGNATTQGTDGSGCSFFLVFGFVANDPVSGFSTAEFGGLIDGGVCIPAGSARMPSERELADEAKAHIIRVVKDLGGPVLDPHEIVIR